MQDNLRGRRDRLEFVTRSKENAFLRQSFVQNEQNVTLSYKLIEELGYLVLNYP